MQTAYAEELRVTFQSSPSREAECYALRVSMAPRFVSFNPHPAGKLSATR